MGFNEEGDWLDEDPGGGGDWPIDFTDPDPGGGGDPGDIFGPWQPGDEPIGWDPGDYTPGGLPDVDENGDPLVFGDDTGGGGYGYDPNGLYFYEDANGKHYLDENTGNWRDDAPTGKEYYGYGADGGYKYVDAWGTVHSLDSKTGEWTVNANEPQGPVDEGTMGVNEKGQVTRDGKVVTNPATGQPLKAAPKAVTPSGSGGGGSSGGGSSKGSSSDTMKALLDAAKGLFGGTSYTKGQSKNTKTYLGDTGQIQPGSPFDLALQGHQAGASKFGNIFDDVLYGAGNKPLTTPPVTTPPPAPPDVPPNPPAGGGPGDPAHPGPGAGRPAVSLFRPPSPTDGAATPPPDETQTEVDPITRQPRIKRPGGGGVGGRLGVGVGGGGGTTNANWMYLF
jgi:hypothetical protein